MKFVTNGNGTDNRMHMEQVNPLHFVTQVKFSSDAGVMRYQCEARMKAYKISAAIGLKGKLSEYRFFFLKIIQVSNLIFEKNKVQDYPLNKEVDELSYYFSAFMNTVQSIKDSVATATGEEFTWKKLSSTYGSFFRYCRNAITHDGSDLISGMRGGVHYITGPLRRMDNHKKIVEFDPPKEPVDQLCVNFSLEFLSSLDLFLSEHGEKIPSPGKEDFIESNDLAKTMEFIPCMSRELISQNYEQIINSFDGHKIELSKEIKDRIGELRELVKAHDKTA